MIKPRMIDIEVSSACQLTCKGCPINDKQAKKGFIDVGLFKSIIDRVKKETPESVIVPWLNGEPLLHPNYLELIKYVDEAGLRYYITTNGMIWNEELFEYITREGSNCYQIIFSLDGLPHMDSRSIELARPGSDRSRVLGTIFSFGELKTKKQSKINMAVKIVERGQDYAEIEEYIHFWLSQPFIDYVCKGKMLSGKTGGMRYKPCEYSDNRFMVIKYDGAVVTCSYCQQATNDRQYSFGILDKETPILEFYNNDAMTKFREDQRKGIYIDPCKECGFAYNGAGFIGVLHFTDNRLSNIGRVYFHEDYYNSFYSLKG